MEIKTEATNTEDVKDQKTDGVRGFSFKQELALAIIPALGSIAAASLGLAASITSLKAAQIDIQKFNKTIQSK